MPKQEFDITIYNRLSPQRREALRPSIESGQLVLVVRGHEHVGYVELEDLIRKTKRDMYAGLVVPSATSGDLYFKV